MNSIPQLVGAAALVGLLTLSGCGSDDSSASSEPTTSAPSGAPTGPGGAFDPQLFQKIRDCVEAAGLGDVLPTDLPTDLPSGAPSDLPTDIPSGTPPSGAPSGLPSGGPGGGLADALSDPDVQSALAACGIDLPQGPGDAPS